METDSADDKFENIHREYYVETKEQSTSRVQVMIIIRNQNL